MFESEGLSAGDYQLRMLRENEIEGLLPVKARDTGESTLYEYNVSQKTSIKKRYEKQKIGAEEMKEFLKQISNVLSRIKSYLLDVNCILLEPEYIFWERGKFSFCYYPGEHKDVWKSFHILTEYFVQRADYQEITSMRASFMLHKETMEENYSLRRLVEEIEQIQKEQKEEETADHDWITHQEMGSEILKETDNLWTPVKRFLQKHKKPKWGDWDGIYIDEEEL